MAEPIFSPVASDTVYVPEVPVETPPVSEVNDAVVPPVVTDEPAATPPVEVPLDTPPLDTPVDTPAPTITETIREVEKIVEKYPEMDEYTGQLFQALMDGKEDELLNYLSEKHRDYTKMSDYDVVKANIKKANPAYTDEIAELKMERQYGELVRIDLSKISAEDEPETYLAAEQHNRKVDDNLKLLKLDAFDARVSLDSAKKEIKLPKIESAQPVNTNEPSPEAIEQGRKDWQQTVTTGMTELTDFAFKVGDKDTGYEDVPYKITDKQRTEITEFLKNANGQDIIKRLGWVDENGKQNVSKMAGDVLKLENLQQIVSSGYTKGKKTGTTGTVAEIKNIDLNTGNTQTVAAEPVDIGVLGFSHLNPK